MSTTTTENARFAPEDRPAQMRQPAGYDEMVRGWQQDGLKWCGIGFCLMAGAVALHGLFAGNQYQGERTRIWR